MGAAIGRSFVTFETPSFGKNIGAVEFDGERFALNDLNMRIGRFGAKRVSFQSARDSVYVSRHETADDEIDGLVEITEVDGVLQSRELDFGGVRGVRSVACNDWGCFLGNPEDDSMGSNAGAVYVFRPDETGEWSITNTIYAPEPAAGREFGSDLGFFDSASLAVAEGMEQQTPKTMIYQRLGDAYVFTRSDTWMPAPFAEALEGISVARGVNINKDLKRWYWRSVSDGKKWISHAVETSRGCVFLYHHGTHSMCRSDHSCYCRDGYGGADCSEWLNDN